MITYEQPLNELIRVSLRLEHLFNKIEENIHLPSNWGARNALAGLLEIVNIVDRPDLKTKLTKALSYHAEKLTPLRDSPQVDGEKLGQLLDNLDYLIDHLYALPGKIGHPLRESEFLNNIRSHLNNPGGACNFSLPAYQLWLEQPFQVREQSLQHWYHEFEPLHQATNILLQLTRGARKGEHKTATAGFFQDTLDADLQGELIRVSVPNNVNIYPEISVGRHRISIRFYDLIQGERAKQTQEPVEFLLTYCAF